MYHRRSGGSNCLEDPATHSCVATFAALFPGNELITLPDLTKSNILARNDLLNGKHLFLLVAVRQTEETTSVRMNDGVSIVFFVRNCSRHSDKKSSQLIFDYLVCVLANQNAL
jgi:hypothetical protein